jgi:hypothetical protein
MPRRFVPVVCPIHARLLLLRQPCGFRGNDHSMMAESNKDEPACVIIGLAAEME